MLFDDEVAAFLKEHFVCVLTDAPWSKVAQRNAPTWEEVESWKSQARNSEILFVVTADKKDRRPIEYHRYTEPERFLDLLRGFAREDGRLPMPEAERDRMVVVQRIRARLTPLRRILRDQPEKERAMRDSQALQSFAQHVADDTLCRGEAAALRARLEADDPADRARLSTTVTAMLDIAAELGEQDDVIVRALRSVREKSHPDLEDVTGLELTAGLLRARLSELAKERGRSDEVAAKLAELDERDG